MVKLADIYIYIYAHTHTHTHTHTIITVNNYQQVFITDCY